MIYPARLRGVGIGVVFEIEAFGHQLVAVHRAFVFRVQFVQYAPVLSQYVDDVAHVIVGATILPVVESHPALVRTEFLVHPAKYGITAFRALLCFHFAKVRINSYPFTNVYKQLQTKVSV